MAKWDAMAEAVEKMRGAQASAEEAFRQLQAKVDELQSGGMSDEEDQRKVDEFAAAFNDIAAKLPKAIVANPGPGDNPQPAPGTESTGGA